MLDFRRVFESAPRACLVLNPHLRIVAVSDAYLRATMTTREAIVGRGIFEVFPDNPDDREATGERNLDASLQRVLLHRAADAMAVQKYDIRRPESDGGGFVERYWNPVNIPVLDDDGSVECILHCVDDVTEFIRLQREGVERDRVAADLEYRTRQLEREIILHAERDKALQAEIAERKSAQARLQESEARLQTIVENLAEGVAVSDLDANLVHFNRAALRMHGFATLEECRRSLHDFADMFELSTMDGFPIAHEEWPLARVLRGEDISGYEVRIRHRREHWQRVFRYGGSLVRSEGARPTLAVITITDITESKLAEEQRRAQLAKLALLSRLSRAIAERQDLKSIFQVVIRSLEDQMPVGFGCIGLYDRVLDVMRMASRGAPARILDLIPDFAEESHIELRDSSLSACLRGQLAYAPDIGGTRNAFLRHLARAGMKAAVAVPMLLDGEVFGVLVVARARHDGFDGQDCEFLRQLCDHVALASRHVSLYEALQGAYDELRQTQQAVLQKERLHALGQMASGVAHDINNAMSPIALYAEAMLESELGLSERARGYLRTISRAVDDVAATVARLREFYRNREAQLVLAPVSLNGLVREVLDLTRTRWRDMAQERGLNLVLHTELAPDAAAIMGAESEIRDALVNLVINALDAMQEGGTLAVRTRNVTGLSPEGREVATHVCVEVSDSGNGMSEEVRRRCLEPFFTTKGERGTGLGLAMVYGMVQRHSAELDIDSEPGKGTTIRIVFPVTTLIEEAAGVPTVAAVPRGLRILLIDDDPALLKSLGDILAADGHVIRVADGGRSGIDLYRASEDGGAAFDVVITDLGMPYVDGRKVAEAVKARSHGTPVIMLTGWGRRMVEDRDIPPYVDRVLSKPPKLLELRSAIAEVTGAGAAGPP